jgi:chromosome partitioning protein
VFDLQFNQSMIAHLTKTTANTVSRTIAANNIQPLLQESSHNKRYDINQTRQITELIYAKLNRPILQKINVFYNFKGGTGKTSLCYQVATHLAILGFKVLVLDLDPQAHLSSVMRIPEEWNGPTIYDVLINGEPFEDSFVEIFPGLSLVPANISMTRIELPLSTKTKREEKLLHILEPYTEKFDYIIMDTNPTISTLNMNALVASQRVNVVCETQPFSLSGLRVLIEEMEAFYGDMNLGPNYSIIPNKYEIKTATAQEILGALRSEYGEHVLSAVVRKTEDINVATKKKLPLSGFCKIKSPAFEDIMDLVHEFVSQTQKPI